MAVNQHDKCGRLVYKAVPKTGHSQILRENNGISYLEYNNLINLAYQIMINCFSPFLTHLTQSN